MLWWYVDECDVVDFSAGVGRTGVFITLSIVLERMRYEGVVDMFQTVKMLRTQRPAMVQTEVSLSEIVMIGFSARGVSSVWGGGGGVRFNSEVILPD